MGISNSSLRLLLAADAVERFHGNFLTLGYNTVTIPPIELERIVSIYGKSLPRGWSSDNSLLDNRTKHSRDYPCFDQVKLLRILFPSVNNVDILDKSAYEGATTLIDLNSNPPAALLTRYDLIYDGSVLDNIFSPSNGLIWIHKLLMPNGRVFGLNVASGFPGAMTMLSAEFFYSFFSSNHYTSSVAYQCCCEHNSISEGHFFISDWYSYKPQYHTSTGFHATKAASSTFSKYAFIYTLYFAQKSSENDESINIPTNLQYISASDTDWSVTNPTQSLSDKLFLGENETNSASLYCSDHYTFLGTDRV